MDFKHTDDTCSSAKGGCSVQGNAHVRLRCLRELLDGLDAEEERAAAFAADPTGYLEIAGVGDMACEFDGEKVLISKIIEAANEKARIPVARALARRMDYILDDGEDSPGEPRTIPIVNAIFNANTLANMNALVNTNIGVWTNAMSISLANENTKTNLNGVRRQVRTNGRKGIWLGDAYYHSSGYRALDSMGYSPLRQEALIAKVLRVQEDRPSPSDADGGRVSRSWGDLCLTITYEHDGDSLVVNSLSLAGEVKNEALRRC